ncbi:hypothetical protein ACH51_14525 [Ralstonia solanacearum]|nr:hypothetical protein ACH51_14525 [Ralstonia solanacearum]
MLGAQHPLARKGLSLKHYIEMPHLAPAPYAVMQRSMIDQALAEQGLKRRIQVSLPYFGQVIETGRIECEDRFDHRSRPIMVSEIAGTLLRQHVDEKNIHVSLSAFR